MTTIQIRNVPEGLSRELKARAALEGRSLSDFLLRELDRLASRPSREQILQQIASRPMVDLPPAEDILREQRPTR